MITLSAALKRSPPDLGDGDIITALYLGALREYEVEVYRRLGATQDQVFHRLMVAFPDLGASVRYQARLSERLEREYPGLLPRVRRYETRYRREIHVSLWRCLTALQGFGRSKDWIADCLEGAGL